MKIVAFADTHGCHNNVEMPDGDILIFAGDMCSHGEIPEVANFANWFNDLPHKTKIIIAGNHDWAFQKQVSLCVGMFNAVYLEDRECTIGGIRIYGSPWTPSFQSWAFMKDRGHDIKAKWDLIPEDIDVLVTHGPPEGVLDNTGHDYMGCRDLKNAVERTKPKHHIFGHCHEDYGSVVRFRTEFLNVSICNRNYNPCREPVVFDIEEEK